MIQPINKTILFITTLVGIVLCSTLKAQTFQSGNTKANLVELYTSEGCSSCPPADRWLSKLKNHPELWKNLVPIAFHVDYWDWIGWKDDFAKPEFGDRQKRYKALGRTRSVYTPGFFVNGSEWRDFFNNREAHPRTKKIPTGSIRALLQDQQISFTFTPLDNASQRRDLIANAALMSFTKSNFVKWGENIGKTLKHDFIVDELHSSPLKLNKKKWYTTLQISNPPIKADNEASPQALAFWVSDAKTGEVLQATGGWILTRQ
ncbi:MAG: DUF1223 domain-containing protein [Pseudomonadales bacterium]|nr:DUF1223 domain-containing protein [Pseudomonadales bacterium]